jgi:hypothetical protein
MNKFNRHKKMTIRSYIDRFLSRYITDRQTDSITLIIQNCTFNQNSSWINRHRETGNKRIRAREKKKEINLIHSFSFTATTISMLI